MKYLIAALAMLWIGAASAEEHAGNAEPFFAQKPVECYPAPILKNSLEIQYNEESYFAGAGKARGGQGGVMTVVVMLYLNPEANTFTVVELQEQGFACIIGAGDIMQLGNTKGIKINYK